MTSQSIRLVRPLISGCVSVDKNRAMGETKKKSDANEVGGDGKETTEGEGRKKNSLSQEVAAEEVDGKDKREEEGW